MTKLHLRTRLLMIICLTIFAVYTSLAVPVPKTTIKLVTIAAEPAVLPYSPVTSPPPGLSPDIIPLFPTPGSRSDSSPDSSLPVIPSSLSPPDPDSQDTHPESSIAPSGAVLESSGFALSLSVSLTSAILLLYSLAFW
ncbi:classical arabinogalactan protein 26-like [Silene latifolia]|uniref:classical arabinogalactan protein 26-like n=1 Tax=Silene latifolia TaxID=37657 RepID=UPI003D77C8ED